MRNSLKFKIARDKYYEKVISFSNSLEPSQHLASSGQPKLMSPAVREKLISSLQAPGSGQDWEHFLLGLGRDRQEADLIRLRQGDIDSLERKHNFRIRDILIDAIEMFERNCQLNSVAINMTNHVVDVLKDEAVMFNPYNKYQYYNIFMESDGETHIYYLFRLAKQLTDLGST